MKRLPLALTLLLFSSLVFAQKRTTIIGDTWTGLVESTNEATREITIVNPNKKTETFAGVLKEGYQVKLKDGTSRELKVSELKPGMRVRFLYKSTTLKVGGRETKAKLINRIDFLGRDDYTRLREMLKLAPDTPVSAVESGKLPAKDPLKIYLALQEPELVGAMVLWVDQWNSGQAAKYGRVKIVDDPTQADVSLVGIWGSSDDPVFVISFAGVSAATLYLVSKDNNGLQVLWLQRRFMSPDAPQYAAASIGKELEKKLKARSK
ncbi:MAG TPA: hypothetical protein VJT15_04875 [Pyrinomonadaceae bacterium]|nr:hypothetical protein [Pyrinomonadaceae bacterium]